MGKQRVVKRKGFTLVELIVVMAIIGILAAVAIPNYTRYVQDAKNETIEADGKLIQEAVLVAILELQSRGEGTGTTDELLERIGDSVKETLPDIKKFRFEADNGTSVFSESWCVLFMPDAGFTSIDQITEFRITAPSGLTYTGEYMSDYSDNTYSILTEFK